MELPAWGAVLAPSDHACEPAGVPPNPLTAPPASDVTLRGEPVARTVFTGLPARYDRLAYLLSFGQDRRWRRAVADHAAAAAPKLVLDVATGPAGVALAVAARTGADVVGVDLNEPMLRAGLPNVLRPGLRGRVRLAAGRADQLPFADATFDAVTFSYLLRYVDDPAATLAEMARCLRPGGTMASLEFAVPPQPAVARGLVVLHAARPARARRPHRRPRLVSGGALPGAEHLGSLPALPPGRARRRLARGRPDRRGGTADEHGWRADHVGQQDRRRGFPGGGIGFVSTRQDRPAFYAVGRGTGGPGDWVTLLHPPYTLWHLSYVVMGAAVMPPLVVWRLGGTLIAFFLAVGIGAHALDELKGRPLGTGIGSTTLAVTAGVSIIGAVVMGLVYGGLRLLPFVVVGCLLVFSYNLELFGGVMHSDIWFGLAWGSFPALVGAYAQHWTLSVAAVAVAAAAFFLSLGQRALSTPARTLRRRVSDVSAQITFNDGREQQLGRADLLAPLEQALRFFVWATGAVALAMALAAR